MSMCDFNNPAQVCPTCGYVAKRLPTYRECRPLPEKVWQPIPLGDITERLLISIGLTKERVEEWTRTKDKPGGCGCSGRQKLLNEWGNKIQYGARDAARAAEKFYLGE